MPSVLIVDDLHSIREFLKINLSSEPDIQVTSVASNGEMAITKAWEFQPDIVLMDINMPGKLDGIQATEKIVSRFPQIKVLLLTSEDNKAQLDRALEAGARGYILKNTGVKDIANILRLAEKGFFQIGPILGNWEGTLHNKIQLDMENARINGKVKEEGGSLQVEPAQENGTQSAFDTNQAISSLSSELFQLQRTIKSQEDTITNLTNQYSEVQQEIKANLKRSNSLFTGGNTNKRFSSSRRRSPNRQNFLFISSFFLGILTVLVLALIFTFLGGL